MNEENLGQGLERFIDKGIIPATQERRQFKATIMAHWTKMAITQLMMYK